MISLGTIRTKLIATFTVIVSLTVGISLMAIFLFHSTQNATNTIITVDMPAVAKTHDLSVTAKGIAAAAPFLAVADTASELKAAQKTLEGLLKNLNKLISEFPTQQSETANAQRIRIEAFVHEFEPVLEDIIAGRLAIITIRKKITTLTDEASSLSTALIQNLEPIKTAAGFNLSLTLMELSKTDDTEADFWRKQAFQTDMPNFQSSMELGLSIQQMHSHLLQVAGAVNRQSLMRFQKSFAREVKGLDADLKKFGSKGTVQPLLASLQALITVGQGDHNLFALRDRQIGIMDKIQGQVEKSHQIASDLTHAAHDFSASITRSAKNRAERLHRSTHTGTYIAGGMALATILLAFIIGWRVVARDIVRRITTLQQKMVEGQQGKLNLKIETRGSDEIADMSRAFAFFVKQMRMDIATRQDNETQIREAMRKAEAASIAKSNFLANMSHEIRTPMNGIVGYGILMADTALDDEQQEFIKAIKTSADHLLGVINDILDFSKIEAGHLELEHIHFNLSTNLENAMETMAIKAREKGLRINCRVADQVPLQVVGDPGRLRQIIVNLMSNAVKFTHRGGVDLACEVESTSENHVRLHIRVSDSGVGIPADKRASIFESFEQADTSTTRKFGGTGLGLSISRQLVEMMGGRIWVESPGIEASVNSETVGPHASAIAGPGSTFHFTIRLGLIQGEDDRLPRDAAPGLEDLRVLIAAPDERSGDVLGKVLDTMRIPHVAVTRARDVLEKLFQAAMARRPYEVVLMDGRMPDMDEVEFCSCIKADSLLGDTAIIMLTSVCMGGDMDRRQEMGLAGYLVKPVTNADLFETLKMVLANDRNGHPSNSMSVITRHGILEKQRSEQLKILLVEDNFINQKMAVKILESKGHDISTADDGRQAIDRLEKRSFDLILMDVQMPVMDGITATQAIRSMGHRCSETPIIAMTANAMKGDKNKCIDAGMDDYISKPIDPEQLFNVIEKQMALKNQHAVADRV